MFSKLKQWRRIQSSSSSAELNIVLIGGRHGPLPSGKSSVGNIILGREAFDTEYEITSQSVMRQELVSGRQVSVVDTPGWRSTQPLDLTPKLTQLEIQHSVSLCPPGPHAFVLVVRLDSPYAGTGMSAEEHVRFLLSDTVWKRTIVVFTVADKNNMDTDLIRSDSDLRYLTEKCEGRFHVLDISDRGDGGQVTELLQKVDQIVQSNAGHYETEEHVSEELKEKQRSIRRRAEQRRRDAQNQPTGPPLGRGSSDRGRTDLRIVMLGGHWSGKSSAGNTILTGSGFQTELRSVQCEVRQGSVAERHVTVVDSPGWWYNRPLQDTSEMDKLEIQDSVCLCPPGPHAVLLAVPLREAFTKEMRVAVEEHMTLLSQSVWSQSIVLFTYGDHLGEGSIEQHIEAEGEDLRWLVDRCGNRYHVFNNKKTDVSQVTQLLEKIDEMWSGNTAGHCEVDGDVWEKMSARKRKMEERVQTLTRKLTTLKALCEGSGEHLSDVRVVLAGGKQADRNRAGNRILQQNVFTETPWKEFKTQPKLTECVRQQSEVADRTVSVVMCPDWSTTPPSQKTKDVLLHGVTLCSPGPHAVLVMVDVQSRFCEADRRSVEEHMELLGDTVWRHALVLFMFGWWLGGRRVEEYIEAEGEPLRRILEKCGYRYHVLHGTGWDISEVTQLMEKTEDMVTRNGGHFKRDESSRVTELAGLFGGLRTGGVKQEAGQTTPSLPEEQSLPNTDPDSDETEFYTLSHNPRGTCLIINNEIFNGKKTRTGTLQDEEELEKVFSKLGFEVDVRTNKTANDIRRLLKELGGQDFTQADALVVCVLSHGDTGCVFGSDGKEVLLKDLMDPFRSGNAPTLAGKPKLFFIQACQGTGYQRGAMAPPPPSPTASEGEGEGQSQVQGDGGWFYCPEVVPNDADFLIGSATVDECQSFRNIKTGSIYIQALCKQLELKAAKSDGDILSVLTDVNRVVSRGQFKNYKQMPEFRNRLTKKLVLNFI